VADIIGTVTCLQIGDDWAFTTIDDGAGDSETFILWYFPTELTSFTRILHSSWVSLLREAKTANIQVRVTSSGSSAYVSMMQLGV
jgi:hypothetical protein